MHDTLLKADIFFFVATLSVVVLTLLLVIGLVYVVSILRSIKHISRTAEAGTETVVAGLAEAKAEMSREGYVPETLINIFKRLYTKSKKGKK